MTHLVGQIVDAMKAALIGLPTTGSNVFDGEPRQLGEGDLPALVIEEGDDRATPASRLYPRIIGHTQNFTVFAVVKAKDPASVRRQIRLEVERALATAGPNLGGAQKLTKDIRPAGASAPRSDYDSETPVSILGISFEVDYQHVETTPDVAY